MLIEQVSITMICIAIVILLFIKKIAKKVNKRWSRVVVLYIAVSFLTVGSALFIRQHFIPFDSAEEAYKSVYGAEAVVVIEGDSSGYVIGNRGDKLLNKNEKGWTVPVFNISVTKSIKEIGSSTIYVSQYNFSEDYYVKVLDSNHKLLTLSDNRNSTFYQIDSKDTSDKQACVYYAYVYKINNEYTITVNGEKVKLFE